MARTAVQMLLRVRWSECKSSAPIGPVSSLGLATVTFSAVGQHGSRATLVCTVIAVSPGAVASRVRLAHGVVVQHADHLESFTEGCGPKEAPAHAERSFPIQPPKHQRHRR